MFKQGWQNLVGLGYGVIVLGTTATIGTLLLDWYGNTPDAQSLGCVNAYWATGIVTISIAISIAINLFWLGNYLHRRWSVE